MSPTSTLKDFEKELQGTNGMLSGGFFNEEDAEEQAQASAEDEDESFADDDDPDFGDDVSDADFGDWD